MSASGAHRLGRRVLAATLWGLLVAAVGLGWWFVAPPELGGRTRYVTVSGSSMEPALSAGDLVAVRPQASYEVGDVVAYRSRSLRAVVLHRIVGTEGDAFVLRGDANGWLDTDRPREDEILGAMALRVPVAGVILAWLRSPMGIATVGSISLAGMVVAGAGVRRRRRRRAEVAEPPAADAPRPSGTAPEPSSGVGTRARSIPTTAFVLGAVLAGATVVGAFAATRPQVTTTTTPVPYQQEGTFSYSASAPDGGAVYGPDGVQTGDPVYLRLVEALAIGFDYRIDVGEVTGTIELAASITGDDGWRRTFSLAPPASFTGAAADVDGTLDLVRLRELIAQMQRVTGVERQAYMVDVSAVVTGEATVSGRVVPVELSASLPFLLDQVELQVFPGDSTVEDLLHPVAGGRVEVTRSAPTRLLFLGVELAPRQVAFGAFALAGLCLVGLAIAAILGVRARRRAEPELIEARYGRHLVAVDGASDRVLDQAIDVASMEALVLLAGRYDQVILHGEQGGWHSYFFRDGGVTYRYRTRGDARGAR